MCSSVLRTPLGPAPLFFVLLVLKLCLSLVAPVGIHVDVSDNDITIWRRGLKLTAPKPLPLLLLLHGYTLGHIDAFDAAAEQWSSYTERLTHYYIANGIVS